MPSAPLLSRIRTALICGLWGLCVFQPANAAPPTGIRLSPSEALEWCPPHTIVGTLTAIDPDVGDTHTFTKVNITGYPHNGGWYISGGKIHLQYGFEADFEAGPIQLLCRVRATDSTGQSILQILTVNMTDDRNEDFDGDGLTEAQEEDIHFTSDLIYDFDGDGVGDGAEVAGLTSPKNANVWPQTAIIGWGDSSLGARAAPVGSNVLNLATGQNHSLSLRANGLISAWGGLGSYGQIAVPPGLTDAVEVSAGGDLWEPDTAHSLALKSDGSVVAWGYTHGGQIVVPPGLSGVVSISAGRSHGLALKGDGTVVTWGYNPHGSIQPPPGLNNVVAVSAGGYHSLALKSDGSVVTWGSKFDGEEWKEATSPVGLTEVTAVAAGRHHSLALKRDGTVVAWGFNLNGQTLVPPGLNGVVSIAAGGFHSMALKNTGSVVSWGSNSHGQSQPPTSAQEGVRLISAGILHSLAVAQGSDYPVITSSPVIESPPNVLITHQVTMDNAIPIEVGAFSALGLPPGLAIDPDSGIISGTPQAAARRSVVIRVETNVGQLTQTAWVGISEGSPPTSISLSPAELRENRPAAWVVGTLTAGDPDVGDSHSFEWVDGAGSTHNGLFRIEGDQLLVDPKLARDFEEDSSEFSIRIRARDASLNPFEQELSIAFLDDRGEDADGDGLTEIEEEEIYFTSDTAYDTDGDGFGDGFEVSQNSLPGIGSNFPEEPIVMLWGATGGMPPTPAGLQDVVGLAAGYNHSLAITETGEVLAWGGNLHGESTVPENLPEARAIDAGCVHSVALLADGTVAAWGNDAVGQIQVPANLGSVVSIAAGAYHNLALIADGTVVAWGDDSQGQRTVPPGLANVVAIAAGGYHSLALKRDGTVVAWGSNWQGIATVPSILSGVIAIAAGGYHSLALKHDGTMVAWGWNDHGQCSIPEGLPLVKEISAGWLHNQALKADGSLIGWGSNSGGQGVAPAEATQIRCFDSGWFHNIALRQTTGFPMFGDRSEVRSWPGESVSRPMPFLNATETQFSAMGLPSGFYIDPSSGLVTGTVLAGERRAVRVSANTDVGTFERIIWFNTADGLPPTVINLSSNTILENSPAGTLVGTLSALDPNLGDLHSFDLVYTGEVPDTHRFLVSSSNQLISRYPLTFNYEGGFTQLNIRVVATDAGNNRLERDFVLQILDDRNEDADADGVSEAMEEDVFGSSDAIFDDYASADKDKDGVPGMLEYAFNLNPNLAGPPLRLVPGAGSTAGLPAIHLVPAPTSGKRLRLEYIRRTGSGLTYSPQFSSGMAGSSWQVATNPVVTSPIVPGWERCVVEDSQPTGTATKRFARVAVGW